MNKVKIISGGLSQDSIPVDRALTIFDQNSQTFKKLWIGSEADYLAIPDALVDENTIYLVQLDTI